MESRNREVKRDLSLDVARGVAIVAIVLGHVERGLSSASLLPYDTAVELDRLLYLFHLATFAYLSGLFVRRAVERDGVWLTVVRRVTLFSWLYLLWTLIQGSVRVAASSVANTPVTVGDVARIWIPEGQLWFLPWLIAVTIVAAVSQPWRDRVSGAFSLGFAALLAVTVWGFDPVYAFSRGWALLLPFLIGCAVTHTRHAALARRLALMVCSAGIALAAWLWIGLHTTAVPPTTGGGGRTASTVGLGVLGCLAGTVAVLALSALLARSRSAGFVALIGRRSLEIFLAHIVVASGTRIVLVQAGIADPWIHLLVATTLGVAVPIALAILFERVGWGWVFASPRWLDRQAGHSHMRRIQ